MISGLIDDMSKGRMIFSTRIKAKILSWWMHHINEVDYNTFKIEQWASPLILKAKNYDEIANLVKLTGIEWVDNEHRKLVEATLSICLQLEQGQQEARSGLRYAWNFAKEHFKREEELFVAEGLWGLEYHQDQHQEFLREMGAMMIDPDIYSPEGVEHFRLWIVRWWILHINETDYQAFKQLEQVKTE